MGSCPPAPDRACQSIKLPLAAPQAFNPAACDALTDQNYLKALGLFIYRGVM